MAGYPVQRGHPLAITRKAARRRLRDSDTLSGTSAEEEQMTEKIMPPRERDTSTVQAAVDAFLSSPRYANPNTRGGYTGVLDRLLAGLGASSPLAEVSGEELAGLLEQLWGQCAPATWNRNRGAVAAWLSWCTANRLPAPVLPASAERRREHINATRAIPRPAIDRALSRRDVPLQEKTLWRMLYETATRASEVLALNIEDLDLDARRAPIRSKGGDTDVVRLAGSAGIAITLCPNQANIWVRRRRDMGDHHVAAGCSSVSVQLTGETDFWHPTRIAALRMS
jgi:integrase